MSEDLKPVSEAVKRAGQDLTEAINDLSADYTVFGQATNTLQWIRSIDRCEKDAANVAQKFAALKLAVLSEPFPT